MEGEKGDEEPTLGELVREIAHDAETLIDQQFQLIRSEWRQELDQAKGAAAALGAGTVLVATGGILTTLMLVHGLQRATRLPLWGCYGLVGGAVGAFGAGLLVGGMRKAGDVHLAVPPQSLAALKENLAWIGDQATRMTSSRPDPEPGPESGGRVTTPETIRAQMVRTRAGLNRKLDALRSRLAGPVADSHEGKEDSMAENAKKKGEPDKVLGPLGRPADDTEEGRRLGGIILGPQVRIEATKSKPKAKADTKSKPEAGARARSKASAKGEFELGRREDGEEAESGERASTTSKTLEVVGEMLAGATVGAVSAVAANVDVSSAPTEPVASELAAMDTRKGKSSGGAKGSSKGAAKKAAKAKSPKELLGEMAAPAAIGAVAGAVEAVLPKKGKNASR